MVGPEHSAWQYFGRSRQQTDPRVQRGRPQDREASEDPAEALDL
jgi:hypothetical protein